VIAATRQSEVRTVHKVTHSPLLTWLPQQGFQGALADRTSGGWLPSSWKSAPHQ